MTTELLLRVESLIAAMNKIGEVVVVAPDSPQSGMGHAITISDTLYCKKKRLTMDPKLNTVFGHHLLCKLQFVKYWTGNQTYVFLESITELDSSINVLILVQ